MTTVEKSGAETNRVGEKKKRGGKDCCHSERAEKRRLERVISRFLQLQHARSSLWLFYYTLGVAVTDFWPLLKRECTKYHASPPTTQLMLGYFLSNACHSTFQKTGVICKWILAWVCLRAVCLFSISSNHHQAIIQFSSLENHKSINLFE